MPPPKADVRRLLKKQQSERNKATKVTHPFAKYDDTGRLMCIVCNSPVKNEGVWQAHLGSAAHRENIQKLKALKERQQQQQQQQQQQALKRRAPSPPPVQDTNKRTRMDEDKQDIELDEDVTSEEEEQEDEPMGLPTDFFDKGEEVEEIEEEEEETNGGALPTGFFDDPEEEARIQGTLAPEEQAKADLEKDVAMFNEAMIEVTQESKQVQEEDDETFWISRHYDLTAEQAAFDSRVDKLKQMRQSRLMTATQDKDMVMDSTEDGEDGIRVELKTSVRQLLKSKPVKQTESMFDDDESSEEEEEDWRAQQL